jgi:hypothetical protein
MIDIGSRKHGPFDSRYPRPRALVDGPDVERSVDRESLDAWEGEGGQVDFLPRSGGHGDDPRRSQGLALPDGLTWDSFCARAYPGMKRHYFPAIAPWYRYRDGDHSSPRASRPARAAPVVGASTAPRSPASSPRRPGQRVARVGR